MDVALVGGGNFGTAIANLVATKLCWGVVLCAAWCSVHAAEDVMGSGDPPGVERFSRSWIVGYAQDSDASPREFIVSAVEKIRRELRIRQKLRVDATAERVTYQIPAGVALDEVIEHYQRALLAGVLFECRGRDCGRSNGWANQVFELAVLYGPDANQFYIAANLDGRLISAYVIERGNRRIYAHVEVLHPVEAIEALTNAKLPEVLAGDGFAVVDGVRPRMDGSLPDASIEVLEGLASRLAVFERQTVFVVCHLTGPEATAALVERSEKCAERVVEVLAKAMGSGTSTKLTTFGAGPLLPRTGRPSSRVELVLPHRQQRD